MSTAQIVAMPLTDEWYAARMTGIGASEIAAAAGLSRYATPLDIYARKRGLLPEIEDNAAMRLGRKLEPVVKSEFSERTGLELTQVECPMLRHPDYSPILATPDAVVCDGNPLECKTTNWRIAKELLGDEGSDHVPDEWVCQTQIQMEVTGTDMAHVAVLIDGRTLKIYRVERNDRLIEGLIEAGVTLWERIQRGDPPDPNWEHPRTAELIKQLYGLDEGKTVVLPEEVGEFWAAQKALGERIKELESERETVRARVLQAMGDAAVGIVPGADYEVVRSRVTRKSYTVKESSYITLREKKVKVK